MITQLQVTVRGGDLLPRGTALVGPAGITARGGVFIAWADILRVGAQETEVEKRPVAGMGAAALIGYGASFVAGPIGIVAAAIAGGVVVGTKLLDTFEVWAPDGRCAALRGRKGTMKQARLWKEAAAHVIASMTPIPAPAPLPPKWRIPLPLLRKKGE
jgi:hypothetical protein